MSYSYKDLSTKNVEELAAIQKDLLNERKIIQQEITQVLEKYEVYKSQQTNNGENLKKISAELRCRTAIGELRTMINDNGNIKELTLLSDAELSIIYNGMDITDYRTKHNNTYPRYIDLERICKEVIEVKTNYPTWRLADLKIASQLDCWPPKTGYKYKYKDNTERMFEY